MVVQPWPFRMRERAGVKVSDINLFELNEAFASRVVLREPFEAEQGYRKRKRRGYALRYPLGATGARCKARSCTKRCETLVKLGVVSMCLGSWMGAAAVEERE